MFAAAVVPDGFGMRASQDEAHMRAGKRSTERVINAVSADPSDLHLLILSPAGSWLDRCMLPCRSTQPNTCKYVWRSGDRLRQSDHAGATGSQITLPFAQATFLGARRMSQPTWATRGSMNWEI